MISLLRRRDFALLWSAGFVSVIGDWLLFAALPFYLYARTGSPAATGSMFIAAALPRIFLGSFAGVLADRWDRKRVMIVADLGRMLIVLPLLAVTSAGTLWIIYGVLFAESSLSVFFGPAKSALIPALMPRESLVAANSLSTFSDNVGRLIGPSIGGVLLTSFGLRSVVGLDALSYLLSAMFLAGIVPPARSLPMIPVASALGRWRGLWTDWIAGSRLVTSNRAIGVTFVAMGIAMLSQGLLNVLFVVYVRDVLHGGAQIFGWLIGIQGAGGLAGALLIGQLGRILSPLRLVSGSLAGIGVCLATMVDLPSVALASVLQLLIGIIVMGWFVGPVTLIQRAVPDAYRGRVFGVYGNLLQLSMLVGMGAATAVDATIGVVPILNLAAGLLLVAGLLTFALMPRVEAVPAAAPVPTDVVP